MLFYRSRKTVCLLALFFIGVMAVFPTQKLCASEIHKAIESHQAFIAQHHENLRTNLLKAQNDNLRLVPYIEEQLRLLEVFVLPEEASLRQRFGESQEPVAEGQQAQSLAELEVLEHEYAALVSKVGLIDQAIQAELKAEQTQADAKMYFMMRVRSEIPSKTLRAYGLMELAREERAKGNFEMALYMWDLAEKRIKESFNEHIAHMAQWRENAKRTFQEKLKKIAERVDLILQDHFVDIPAGQFSMGSGAGGADEMPTHLVTIPAFKLGKTEVPFELYDLCTESTRCFAVPRDDGWGRGEQPVINVSYRDIKRQFLPWLNKITGKTYRLPSEAEWEYAARAGSATEYSWGDNITCDLARFDGGITSVCNTKKIGNQGPYPVASFAPNPFGLFDMHGNTWEWVEDCWNPSYQGAPIDGSAWTGGNCNTRVLRGGAWNYPKNGLRSANRYFFQKAARKPGFGFRLAIDSEQQ